MDKSIPADRCPECGLNKTKPQFEGDVCECEDRLRWNVELAEKFIEYAKKSEGRDKASDLRVAAEFLREAASIATNRARD